MLERLREWFRRKRDERRLVVTGIVSTKVEREVEASRVALIQAKLKELAK